MKVFDTYPGGKGGDGTYQTLINLIPPHNVFIDGYLGNSAVMRYKLPAPAANVGIDTDVTVIDRWKAVDQLDLIKIDLFKMPFLKYWKEYGFHFNYPDTYVFLDPPYPMGMRKSGEKIYTHEMTDSDHEKLLVTALSMKAMVGICTYDKHPITGKKNKMYRDYLDRWNRLNYQSTTRKGQVTETFYMNYDLEEKLHDYRYLGRDYTDRQRIKRKIDRHVNKLEGLAPLERNAILQKLNYSFQK